MAITKIHPIKTTLDQSIDYICNPKKTDGEILISSYRCGYKTAALEFQNTKEFNNSQCKNLARHLIQSFMPGEVTPTLAHQIGQELCDKHLQGKYEYVMTTHIDKEHVHNHIIFNNVNYHDGKAYASNKRSYRQIREISDAICQSNGLSIATGSSDNQIGSVHKGYSYKEYQERKRGNSYKARLQTALDLAIQQAKDWDDFLSIIRASEYEIKNGKHIAFRAKGQERFTRSKTIGDNYTEERIKERIVNKESPQVKFTSSYRHHKSEVIDISSNELAAKSEAFARWLKLQNLKITSKSWNEISQKGIKDIDSLYSLFNDIYDELGALQSELKSIENETDNVITKIRQVKTYQKYKHVYTGYRKAKNPEAFFQQYESELILFESAHNTLLDGKTNRTPVPSLIELKEKHKHFMKAASSTKTKLATQQETISEINQLRANLETYLKSERNEGTLKSIPEYDRRKSK